jgi:hypothetical protein
MRVFALGGNAFFRLANYDRITEGRTYNLKTSVQPLAVPRSVSRFITDLAATRRGFENRLWVRAKRHEQTFELRRQVT